MLVFFVTVLFGIYSSALFDFVAHVLKGEDIPVLEDDFAEADFARAIGHGLVG